MTLRARRRSIHLLVATAAAAGALAALPSPVAFAAPVPLPATASIAPKTGPVVGGTLVRVHGANLGHATQILFGSRAPYLVGTAFTRVSPTTVQARTPIATRHGRFNVHVANSRGRFDVGGPRITFSYVPRPRIMRITPSEGTGRVRIEGLHFPASMTASIGGLPATDVETTAEGDLTVAVPSDAGDVVSVSVGGRYGESAAVQMINDRFVARPTITTISARVASSVGGQFLNITGRNFQGLERVRFGKSVGRYVGLVRKSNIYLLSPKHRTGIVQLRVVTRFGTSAPLRFAFTPHTAMTWSPRRFNPAAATTSLSCWAKGACAASDELGNVYRLKGSTWSSPVPVLPLTSDELTVISCSSATDCVLVGNGLAATLADGTWTTERIDQYRGLTAVSCVPTLCVALDIEGGVLTYRDSTWSNRTETGLTNAVGLSCVSASACVASGRNRVSTFDGTAWTAPVTIDIPLDPEDGRVGLLGRADCTDPDFCMIGGLYGSAHYSAGAWQPADYLPGFADITTVSCTSATFCLGVLESGEVTAFDGTTWSDPETAGLARASIGINSVSCLSPTYCVVLAGSGSSAIGGLAG